MGRGDSGSKRAVKKHDHDHKVQEHVRNFKNGERWQDWTSCQMYGHNMESGRCRDCGDLEAT